MRRILPVVLLLVLLAPEADGQSARGALAVLSPGDVVRIAVWRQPELSGEFEVAADSTIRHPLYREVRVAGVELAEAEARVRAFLTGFEANPRFVMEPLFRVAVGGEVRSPNLYTLPPEVTVAQAVAMAGGPTDRGRLSRVRLVRHGQMRVLDLTEVGGEAARMPIRSGDQILVERRSNIFRDYIVPGASITGALVTIINFVVR